MKNKKQQRRTYIDTLDIDGLTFNQVRDWLKKIEKENPQYKEFRIDKEYETDYDGSRYNTFEVIAFREETDAEYKQRIKAIKEWDKQRLESEKKIYEALKEKFEKADTERQVKRKEYFKNEQDEIDKDFSNRLRKKGLV